MELDFKASDIEIKRSKNDATSSFGNIKNKYQRLKVKRYAFGIKNVTFEAEKGTLPISLTLLAKR